LIELRSQSESQVVFELLNAYFDAGFDELVEIGLVDLFR
jgi:hypothetical protein